MNEIVEVGGLVVNGVAAVAAFIILVGNAMEMLRKFGVSLKARKGVGPVESLVEPTSASTAKPGSKPQPPAVSE